VAGTFSTAVSRNSSSRCPQQRVEASWYRGTADAVYQNLDIVRIHAPDFVLVLAGDHVYNSVILPNVDFGRDVVLKRRIVDRHCRLPEGLVVGLDPVEDRRRFHVTDRGVTLVIPEMLGQQVHHLR
jgi:ADP-glucose pyrophosphorylase